MKRLNSARLWLPLILFTALLSLPALIQSAAQSPSDSSRQAGRTILHGRWEGTISPVTQAYIERLLIEEKSWDVEAILLELETPGGLDTAMREIIKLFLAADIPVIVYVHPSGARAASAGLFITMAAHVAAMTPGTNIGSAHPVAIGTQMDSTMSEKVTHDAAAYARSIANQRNRNVEWAEEAVRRSVSATAEEAVENNIIDFVAESVEELLEIIDGTTVELVGGDHIMRTSDARLEPIPVNLRERLLGKLADPNLAYIFMLLGMYGLIFELQNPGAIFPGIVGVICLLLAFMSFQTLPLNVAGLALILLAVVLFILEIKITSYGMLTIGGIISMLLGSLMLFDTVDPAMRVSIGIIITAVVVTTLFFAFAIGMGLKAQSRKVTTGHEGLVGEIGSVHSVLDPIGTIAIHGEFWKAESATGDPIEAGSNVEVIEAVGLQLLVRPAPDSPFRTKRGQDPATV